MSWSLHRWVWLLEAPLFVGAPPAGALNRCRPYVLARGVWGALTSESAQAATKNGVPDYHQRGANLRDRARFTYLYPAARSNGAWRAWLPEYGPGTGLVWRREDYATPGGAVLDRQFRRWLIDARPGTAIDADSDTAAEATLRETECVMTKWRLGSPSGGEPVALVGYVFLKDTPASDLDDATTLFIGGDTRYGLGRLRRIEFAEADRVFGALPSLDGGTPYVVSRRLLGHGTCARGILGAKEAVSGWDRTAATEPLVSIGGPRWAPGSIAVQDVTWAVDPDGNWTSDD